jgi:fibro-slime domain-containing protein
MSIGRIRLASGISLSLTLAFIACGPARPPGSDDSSSGSSPGTGGGTPDDFGTQTGGSVGNPEDDLGEVVTLPPTEHCGDSVLDEDEACDDGNKVSDDGCGSNCRYVEKGFVCPDAGQPCRGYAKCGDGVIVMPEQCDDKNTAAGDGCSATCKFELGFTCDAAGCRPTVCGDGVQEGTETCEDTDKNTIPFDGCDAQCNKEPDCASASGMGCTTSCGDGLIIGDEECDDGNGQSFDGCSSECKKEPGYECTVPAVDPNAPLNLPIVFRDFSVNHPDFQAPDPLGAETRPCDGYSPGIPTGNLDAAGKPVFASAPAKSCVSAAGFAQWYTTSSESDTYVKSIMLYPNGNGGYVNRFGANGEPYVVGVKTPNEQGNYTSLAACETGCESRARDSQYPFTGDPALRCGQTDTTCQAQRLAIDQENNDLTQLENQLTQAEQANPVDPDRVAELEADIVTQQGVIADAEAAFDTCLTDCQTEFDEKVATCSAMCLPCSSNPSQYCIGGEVLELDGNPLFFPVDDDAQTLVRSPNGERSAARIPAQVYQGLGWPWEDPSCTDGGKLCTKSLHNFAFTSEIAYWFEYTADMDADLTFLGDDDVFVFVNRHLLLDIGGIHVPLGGQLTINGGTISTRIWEELDPGDDAPVPMPEINKTMTAASLGLEPGKVYEIKVFHAERKPEGSSFQLTLGGFNAGRSTCVPICGDAIIASGEQCDLGAELNVGGHNGCNADCTLGSYCGDGIVQTEDGEQCDDADPAKPPNCAGCRVLILK